jgi:hypothetical protein
VDRSATPSRQTAALRERTLVIRVASFGLAPSEDLGKSGDQKMVPNW